MIKKLLAALLVVFVVNAVFAGDTISVKKFSRFYAGVSFTPGVSYRLLKYDKTYPIDPSLSDSLFKAVFYDKRNTEEKPAFGFNVGLRVGVRATSFLSIETGIDYACKGYSRTTRNLIMGDSYFPDMTIDPSRIYTLKSNTTFHYIDVPVALNFILGKKKVKGIISTGTVFDFITGASNVSVLSSPATGIERYSNHTTKVKHTSAYNVSPFLGVGIDYTISPLMNLRVMPVAQMQVINNTEGPIKEYLYSVGINMSLMFNLPKAR